MAAKHDHDDDDHDYDDDDGYDDDGDDGDGEPGRIRTLDSLAEAIERLEQRVERAFSSGAGRARNSSSQPGGSGHMTQADNAYARRAEIREELAALKAQEKADAEKGEFLTRLGKVEKAMERPPRQLRRIEELMGWHRS